MYGAAHNKGNKLDGKSSSVSANGNKISKADSDDNSNVCRQPFKKGNSN